MLRSKSSATAELLRMRAEDRKKANAFTKKNRS